MNKRVLFSLVISALLLAACAGAAATGAPAGQSGGGGSASVAPQNRTIYLAAVEFKGTTNVSNSPFPTEKLPEGKGYVLVEPDANGAWLVETYQFSPGTIVVNRGDKVTLEVVGINGKEHDVRVEGYNVSGAVKRGHVARLTFTADKAGTFSIMCRIHVPTMQANLIVLTN